MIRYLFLLLFICTSPSLWADDEVTVVEIRGDRTIIYPQQMELNGEETLLDILEMCPDMMAAGFDDLLGGDEYFDAYQLRIDNVPVSGDPRQVLTQLKARLISKIQVCDNAGVAKGRTGSSKVIDVNLLKAEQGAHGFLSLQGATDKLLAPSANFRYGSEKTDIWSQMSYTHTDADGHVNNAEYLHFQMTHRFSDRDRLLSYFTQSSSVSDNGEGGFSEHDRSESFMARFRYFHTFNEQGTELLTVLSWAHKNGPADIFDSDKQMYRREHSHTNSPIWMLELNTPLFVKNLSMMLGYEGDLNIIRYGVDQSAGNGTSFSEESTHQVMNNDLYLQFNYVIGPLRFTIGDRVVFYHYKQKGYKDNWSKNDTRNHFQFSTILTPHRHHQIQAAYYHKFRNPSEMRIYPEEWPDLSGTLIGGNPDLEETKFSQFKLAYSYHTRRLIANLSADIYHTDDNHYWTINGGAYKRFGMLTLTGGFNFYRMNTSDNSRLNFADIRFNPALYLPGNWQVAAKFIWYSSNAPHRVATDNTSCYTSIQVNKQWATHWDLQLQWHDLFYRHYSACLAGIAYRF